MSKVVFDRNRGESLREQMNFRLPDDIRRALMEMQGETGQNRTFLLCLAIRFYQKHGRTGLDVSYTKLKESYTKNLQKSVSGSEV